MILPTYDLFGNDWWQYVSLSNINGVMGMSYWPNPQDPQSFWTNMMAQGYNSSLVVSLMPTLYDYAWIPNAPNMTNVTSQVIVGDYNITDFINVTSNQINIRTNANSSWVFNLTMGFGLTNTSGEIVTEYYTNLTNSTYNEVLIETAYPGIGLGT